jgi:hypothetical protein
VHGAWAGAKAAYVDPSGWTPGPQVPVSTGSLSSGSWWKISDGTETTVTISMTGTSTATIGGTLAQFEGPFEASPLDVTAENEASIGTGVTSIASGTTATTAQADELLVAVFGVSANQSWDNGSRAYSNSFTNVAVGQDSTNRAGSAMAKLVVSATGTYTTTMSTTDTGSAAYGAILTFKKQAAAGGDTPHHALMLGIGR